MREQVEQVLERIRPALQADGGDVELVEITTDGVVKLRLQGSCIGCPSSTMTLQMGIERALKNEIPQIARVEAVM